jgi:hypothetical protein
MATPSTSPNSNNQRPEAKNLTADNITENTILINSQGPDVRMKYILERLVTHLHDFARETRLSTKEWMAGLDFLVQVGQISTDVRHVSLESFPYEAIQSQSFMCLNES